MRRVLSSLFTIILLISTSCEKDKEIDLADYLIGEWLTPTMYSNYYSFPCHYEMIIKTNLLFSIERVESGVTKGWTNWPYTIDEGNKTITIISVDGNTTEITYSITLTDDPNTMIWTTEEQGGETFLWQRGDVDISEL